jgi:hypothetical protein
VLYFAMGDRSAKLLAQLEDWMSEQRGHRDRALPDHRVTLIGDAISGLTT